MESALHETACHVALAVQAIAILIAAIGSARALVGLLRAAARPRRAHIEKRVVSLEYEHWLIAGLTFQHAADVVSTSFSPKWGELGRLAAVAGIRTFLSCFLDHETENTSKLERAGAAPDMRAVGPLFGD